MTQVPVLLLDIDGVINSLLKKPPAHAWASHDWNAAEYTFLGTDWPLLWSTPVIEWLNSLGDRVEVRWHTTWQHEASAFAKIVGLPLDWPVAVSPEFDLAHSNWSEFAKSQIMARRSTWWKYAAGERVLTDEQRHLLWIDDDLELKTPRGQRRHLAGLGPKVCLISPDGHTGITRKHMLQVESFLTGLEEARGAVSGS